MDFNLRSKIMKQEAVWGTSNLLRVEKSIKRELMDEEIAEILIHVYSYTLGADESLMSLRDIMNLDEILVDSGSSIIDFNDEDEESDYDENTDGENEY